MSEQKPKCFVIMPFGKVGTPDRDKYDTVYEFIIKKPVIEAGFECIRGDEIPSYGPIPEQVKGELAKADLVIADLSGRNVNVFYELGYRHAMGYPSISISDDLDGLPFNVATYRTIRYRIDDFRVTEKCRESIREYAVQVRDSLRRKAVPLPSQDPLEVTVSRLETNLNVGLSNLYQLIAEVKPRVDVQAAVSQQLTDLRHRTDDYGKVLESVHFDLSKLAEVPKFISQTLELGLVGMYRNRSEAIEHEFYALMQEETQGISIVGSTMYGMKGYRTVTFERVTDVLLQKARQPSFNLRILLTHWDYISSRQIQESTDKNVARYVISKELMAAVTMLQESGLAKFAKFYRGSPTCTSILCEGQKRMLVNPYPYESEAINSWTAILKEGEIFSRFKTFHFDRPWDNAQLAVPFTDECVQAVKERLRKDIEMAREEMGQGFKGPPGKQ